jgi:hypothetical protein
MYLKIFVDMFVERDPSDIARHHVLNGDNSQGSMLQQVMIRFVSHDAVKKTGHCIILAILAASVNLV